MRDPESEPEIPPFPIEALLSAGDREAIRRSAADIVKSIGQQPVYKDVAPATMEQLSQFRGLEDEFMKATDLGVRGADVVSPAPVPGAIPAEPPVAGPPHAAGAAEFRQAVERLQRKLQEDAERVRAAAAQIPEPVQPPSEPEAAAKSAWPIGETAVSEPASSGFLATDTAPAMQRSAGTEEAPAPARPSPSDGAATEPASDVPPAPARIPLPPLVPVRETSGPPPAIAEPEPHRAFEPEPVSPPASQPVPVPAPEPSPEPVEVGQTVDARASDEVVVSETPVDSPRATAGPPSPPIATEPASEPLSESPGSAEPELAAEMPEAAAIEGHKPADLPTLPGHEERESTQEEFAVPETAVAHGAEPVETSIEPRAEAEAAAVAPSGPPELPPTPPPSDEPGGMPIASPQPSLVPQSAPAAAAAAGATGEFFERTVGAGSMPVPQAERRLAPGSTEPRPEPPALSPEPADTGLSVEAYLEQPERKLSSMFFGVVVVGMGVVCAVALAYVFQMARLEASKAGEAVDWGAQAGKLGRLGLASIAFLTLGLGLVFLRRWARSLMLALCAVWLGYGAATLITSEVFFPSLVDGVEERLRTAGELENVQEIFGRTKIFVLWVMGILAVVNVFLPGVLLLFFSRPNVRATFERADPRVRWTDRCPAPVLALIGFILSFAGVALFAGMRGVPFPLFERMLGGDEARIGYFSLAGLLGIWAFAGFWCRRGTWWLGLLLGLVLGTMLSLPFFLGQAGDGLAILLQGSTVKLGPVVAGSLLAGIALACFLYLLTIAGYFHRGAQPSSEGREGTGTTGSGNAPA